MAENIGNFTDLHIEKNSNWKLRLNGTISVTGTETFTKFRKRGSPTCDHR